MATATKRPYHHGNLRAALVDAGFDLAREGGPDAVVLRETSRRVGVSHNAAYRHFPDREALLGAVGERCMAELGALMERLIAQVNPDDPSPAAAMERLRATGTAYVTFALTEPGLFRTGFHKAGDTSLAELHTVTTQAPFVTPYELLNRQLDGLVAAGAMTPERRPLAEFAAWSAVHGFSMLCLDGPLRTMATADREAALTRMLDAVGAGLTGP